MEFLSIFQEIIMNIFFKSFLCIFLLSLSGQGFADWKYIAKDKEVEFYIDKSSIKKEGNHIKFWLRSEFEEHPLKALSSLLVHEVDCKKRLIKTLYIEAYDQHNLKGNIIASGFLNESDPTGSFEKVAKQTTEDVELDFVCK